MSDLVVPNIICFRTQRQLATLNNIVVLLKSVLTDLRACSFMHPKPLCVTVRATSRALKSILKEKGCVISKGSYNQSLSVL